MLEPIGAAAEFVASNFGGGFVVRDNVIAVGLVPVVVAPNDPDRVALVVVNIGAVAVTINYRENITLNQGIVLLDNGSTYSVNVRDDAILPAWMHAALSSGVGSTLFVVEIIRETRK